MAEEKGGEEQLGTTPANAFGLVAPYEIFCASPSLNRRVSAAAAAGVGCCCWLDFVEFNLLSFFLSVAGVIQGKRNEWVATNTVLEQLFCEEEEEEEEVGN